MSANDLEVRVGADTSGLARGMDDAGRAVRDGSRNMEGELRNSADKMQGIASQLQSRLLGLFSIGAIVGFVKSTKEAVTQAEGAYRGLEAVANHAGIGIGKAMQSAARISADGLMTTAEASKALQNLLARGYNIDQAETTLLRLKDAAAFNRAAHLSMGEAVVTASEGLKNENSILVDNAGVTKNVSKMWEDWGKAHGVSVSKMTQAQKITAEYNGVLQETAAQLGNAEKASTGLQGQDAKLTAEWQNMKIMVGEALIPAFAKLAEWGSWLVSNVFVPLLKVTKMWGAAIGALAMDFSIVWDAVTNFDFEGIMEKRKRNLENFAETAKDIWNEQAGASFQPNGAAGTPGTPGAPASGGGGTDKKTGSKKSKADGPVDVFDSGSYIAGTKDVADFIRDQFEDVNSMEREMAADSARLAQMRARATRDAALEELATRRDVAQQDYEFGAMTKGQLLALEEQFEQRRAEIHRTALAEEQAAVDPTSDPVAYEALKLELEEVEAAHQARMAQIRGDALAQQVAPMMNVINSMESGLMQLGNAVLTNWRGVGTALKGVLANIGQSIIQETILKPLTAKIAAFAKERVLAMARMGTNAAEAGSGAAASQASIPFVGPVLAIAAMGAIFAAVMGMSSKVPSAAGGFDIPGGVNPLTQLHEKEMVLPAKYAEVIRGMAGGAEGGEAAEPAMPPISMNITTMDSVDVKRFMLDNRGAVADAIKAALRDFRR
jgi:hypothetical protein